MNFRSFKFFFLFLIAVRACVCVCYSVSIVVSAASMADKLCTLNGRCQEGIRLLSVDKKQLTMNSEFCQKLVIYCLFREDEWVSEGASTQMRGSRDLFVKILRNDMMALFFTRVCCTMNRHLTFVF